MLYSNDPQRCEPISSTQSFSPAEIVESNIESISSIVATRREINAYTDSWLDCVNGLGQTAIVAETVNVSRVTDCIL